MGTSMHQNDNIDCGFIETSLFSVVRAIQHKVIILISIYNTNIENVFDWAAHWDLCHV